MAPEGPIGDEQVGPVVAGAELLFVARPAGPSHPAKFDAAELAVRQERQHVGHLDEMGNAVAVVVRADRRGRRSRGRPRCGTTIRRTPSSWAAAGTSACPGRRRVQASAPRRRRRRRSPGWWPGGARCARRGCRGRAPSTTHRCPPRRCLATRNAPGHRVREGRQRSVVGEQFDDAGQFRAPGLRVVPRTHGVLHATSSPRG